MRRHSPSASGEGTPVFRRSPCGEDVWCWTSELSSSLVPKSSSTRHSGIAEPPVVPTSSGLAAERAAKGEPRIRLLLDGTAFLYSIFRHARLGPSWEWAIGTNAALLLAHAPDQCLSCSWQLPRRNQNSSSTHPNQTNHAFAIRAGGEYGIMDSALRKRVQLLHAAGIEVLPLLSHQTC